MFVILVGGTQKQRDEFTQFAERHDIDDKVVWINNRPTFHYIANLFINFGGPVNIPSGKLIITWSGDHQETYDRAFKTLNLK
jgi:hypothetical protein